MRRLTVSIANAFVVAATLTAGVLGLSCVACGAGSANPAKFEVTTSNIKDLVIGGNPSIAAAALDAEAAAARTGQLARSFVPSLELRAEQESVQGEAGGNAAGGNDGASVTAYGAELTVNLFNGGRDRFDEETRKLASARKEFEFRRITAGEVEKGRTALLRIIYLQEKIALLEMTIATNSQNLAATQKRIRSGVTTQSDRFDFEMKDVDLRRDLAAVRLDLATERRSIVLLTGLQDKAAFLFFLKGFSTITMVIQAPLSTSRTMSSL